MYKVLIVDDEPYVRKGLKALIDWEQYGYTVCAEAEDGEEALQKIKDLQPNLVITDIKMPGITGLELIKRVAQERVNQPRFIILSGYNEFEFARAAIKYNVKDYILKPVDMDELVGILHQIRSEIESEILQEKEKVVSMKVMAQDTAKKLISGMLDTETVGFAAKWLNIVDGTEFGCVLVDTSRDNRWTTDQYEEEMPFYAQSIRQTLIECIKRENALNVFEDEQGRYGILINHAILKEYKGDLKALVSVLHSRVSEKCGSKIAVYVGEMGSRLVDLNKSYRSCMLAIYRNFFNQRQDVVLYEEIKNIAFSYSSTKSIGFLGLLEAIENNNTKNIEYIIHNTFMQTCNDMVAPEIIRAHIVNFALEVVKVITDLNGNVEEFLKPFNIFRMDNMTVSEFKNTLNDFCLSSAAYIASIREKHSGSVVVEVERYVKKNYRENINLKSIAECFYINPVYLGKVFKKHFGVNFNQYLHDLRMEEAKKLLRRTDYKIYEIADMVGYSDSDYFISKFERVTGMTPSQYKKTNT